MHASFQSCCDTAASNQLGSANIIDNIIGSGNFGDHLYITWVPRGRPRRQARLLQRSPHTRIAGSLRVPSSPKGSHGSERASRRWCGRMCNFGHRSCRWLECVFCVQPASAMQSDNKCNIMVSSSTQRSKPRSDLDAKKERRPPPPPPPPRRQHEPPPVGAEQTSVPEGFPMPPPDPKRGAVHPNQSTKEAAKEVNAIVAKKMPRTPAVPPVGRKIVQLQPDRSLAKVSVINLNSGPFVKALWKTKIACQPDSDSGESSTPSDAMPRWPPQVKAMPKNRHRANAVLQWLQ